MAFRCGKCKEVQVNKTKPVNVVTEIRSKVYPMRHKNGSVIDNGGAGWEIVKEIKACASCAELLNKVQFRT